MKIIPLKTNLNKLPTLFLLGLIIVNSLKLQSQQKPNIVVFIADDASVDFGCYANDAIQTPNIDRLAKEGMRFTQAFLTAPQCSPSRTSILSGQFAHTIGTEDLHNPLDSVTQLVPHYLKQAGYFSGLMLKGHLGDHGHKQFNWQDTGYAGYGDGTWYKEIRQNTQNFIKAAGDDPFFLWVGFIDPHRPYQNEPIGAPEVHDPEKVKVPPYLVDDEATRKDLAAYYDEIRRMDGNIGKILEELEIAGKMKNTIVLFLSDNGFPFPRGKGTLYDSGIHTPLIVKWPENIKPNSVYDGLVSTIDLAPTLLDLANIPLPEQFYGKSLKNVLLHPENHPEHNKYVFSEKNWHGWDDYMRSVRTKKYKLIYDAYPHLILGATDGYDAPSYESLVRAKRDGKLTKEQMQIFEHPRPTIELYDVQNDPYELNNLAEFPQTYKQQISELYGVLLQWQEDTKDHDPNTRRMTDTMDRVSGAYYGTFRSNRYIDD